MPDTGCRIQDARFGTQQLIECMEALASCFMYLASVICHLSPVNYTKMHYRPTLHKIPVYFLVFILSVLIFIHAKSQSVKMNGQLKVEGTQLVNQQGQPVVLRGMSFGWHNWWPRFYTVGSVKWLHNDWKCSVVRAAMGVEPDEGYIKKPDWSKERVKAVV